MSMPWARAVSDMNTSRSFSSVSQNQSDEAEAKSPTVAKVFGELKGEIARLQRQYGDDGRYADPDTWPRGGVDGEPGGARESLGRKTAAEAIAASGVLGR